MAVDLYIGKMVGHLRLLGKVRKDKFGQTRWRVECTATKIDGTYCGKRATIKQWYVTRPQPKTHCGCQFQTLKSTNPKIRRAWMNMRQRCNYVKHVAYAEYGGRGIKVCPEWDDPQTGFEAFLEYFQSGADGCGMPPTEDHTLDRIDNDSGYRPGNIRWSRRWTRAATSR